MAVDYGQDAPNVVRGLLSGGALLLTAALVVHLTGLARFVHAGALVPPAIALLATAAWMLWSSRFGKRRTVEALLDRHSWRGDEVVLDIGCGLGLAAIAAARRVQSGRVIGIDRWRQSDLAGNAPEAARANTRATGVAAKVSFATGDATTLPFADATFDVAVSMTAFHNIKPAAERGRAVEEAFRVLRPGGTLLIFDLLYTPAYAAKVRSAGGQSVTLSRPGFLWALPGWSMTARKMAAEP
jgi:arsenite methyltransferase